MSENSWSSKYSSCIKCNTTNHPHKAKGLCTSCYQKEHSYPQKICSICGNLARVHKKVDGKAICRKCYKQPIHTCSICNKQSSAAVKLSIAEFVCDSCYIKHYRNKQICSICGKSELLAINSIDKKVCIKCYSSPNNLCSRCGRSIESPYVLNGAHVCSRCYENFRQNNISTIDVSRNSYICSICGKQNSVQHIYSDNSVICPDCAKQQSDICYSCYNPLLPIYSHLDAKPYCRNCYHKQKFIAIFTNLKKNWCEIFTSIMEDYFNNKALTASYESIWTQVKKSELLLNDLNLAYSDNNYTFTSIIFINLISNYSSHKLFINDLIAFLYSKSIFVDYDNGLFLLNNLNEQISKLSTNLQNTIATYKEGLLSKLKRYTERGWVFKDSRFTYYTCYLYLLTAIRFLNFCYTLLDIGQSTQINNQTLDAYIRLKPYDKGNLRHFVKYINKNKLTFTLLYLPCSNYRHDLNVSLSDNKQKQLLEVCLYNSNIRLRDRIIIILMLLYGLTPQDIRQLKISNFSFTKSESKTKINLCFKKTNHEIPEIIIFLFIEYLNTLNSNNEYAFPGRHTSTAISLSSVCRIVSAFDVTATELYYTAVNNAMINGLYHPALLMKNFGINHLTATRYYKLIRSFYEF